MYTFPFEPMASGVVKAGPMPTKPVYIKLFKGIP